VEVPGEAVNKIKFFVTFDQADALETLDRCRAGWLMFGPSTWLALLKRGLVTLDPKPMLTPAGRAFLAVNRLLEAVNRISEPEEAEPSHARADAHTPARQDPLVSSRNLRPHNESTS
jgi:hypothetical protein